MGYVLVDIPVFYDYMNVLCVPVVHVHISVYTYVV